MCASRIRRGGQAGAWLVVIVAGLAAGPYTACERYAKPIGGTIRGTVRVEGNVPKLPPLNITKDRDVCKDVPNESLVVGPDNGLGNAVVAVIGVPKETMPREPHTIPIFQLSNEQCRFIPHVLAMEFDADLEISNRDRILHTAKAHKSQINIGLFPGRIVRKPIGAPELGPVKVTCEIHPWMLGWIFLTDNPYYAVSDIHGEYEIDNVPPGKYKLTFWHELFGIEQKAVEVKAGVATELDFAFRAENAVIK